MLVNLVTLEKHLVIVLRQYARATGTAVVMTNGELLERTKLMLRVEEPVNETPKPSSCTCPMGVRAMMTPEKQPLPGSWHSVACPLHPGLNCTCAAPLGKELPKGLMYRERGTHHDVTCPRFKEDDPYLGGVR